MSQLSFKNWPLVILLVSSLLLLQFFELSTTLRYEREAIDSYQIWRLLSAHLVHLSWTHTLLNITGLVLCWLIYPPLFGRYFLLKFLYLSVGVSLLLWFLQPHINDYVGLSGVLYGVLVLALWYKGGKAARLAIGVIVLWALWQWQIGSIPAEEAMIGGHILGVVHVYGLLLAALWLVGSEVLLRR